MRVVLVVVLRSVLSVSAILGVLGRLHCGGTISSVLSLVYLLLLLLLLVVHGRPTGFLFIWLLCLLRLLRLLDRPGGGLLGLLSPILGLLLVPRVSTIPLMLHVLLGVRGVHLCARRTVLLKRREGVGLVLSRACRLIVPRSGLCLGNRSSLLAVKGRAESRAKVV